MMKKGPDIVTSPAAVEYAKKYAAQGELLASLVAWSADDVEVLARAVANGTLSIVEGRIAMSHGFTRRLDPEKVEQVVVAFGNSFAAAESTARQLAEARAAQRSTRRRRR